MPFPAIPRSEGEYRSLVADGETDDLKFRARLPRSDHLLGRVLTGFAEARGGLLVIGVEQHGRPIGLRRQEADDDAARLRQVAARLLPHPAVTRVLDFPQGSVLVASIHPNRPDAEAATTPASPTPASPTTRVVTVFAAMSFHDEEEPALADYFAAMRRAAEQTGTPSRVVRIDHVAGDYEISQEILKEIDKADILIADFTLNSRNVYFELGYARGRGKRTIQTARQGTELEFDVRQWRTIFYRSAKELQERLTEELRSAYRDLTAG